MTNWEKFCDDIYDYVDGLLPLDEKKRIDRQLQDDEHARQFFDEVKALRSQLRNLHAVKISSDFDTVLRTRIKMERSIGRRGWLAGPLPMPTMIAAGALVLLAAIFLFNPNDNTFTREQSVANSGFPVYQMSQSVSRNGVQGTTAVRYAPVDPILVPSRGMAIDRVNPPSPNASKVDSTREFPFEGHLMQVEF